ncbi:archease [Halomonas sp. EGI 63088]|uniref:Archease n=1 Tax=Halomonas flagellata TaxID=2920385 RepID=A0ABS9RQY6_9GAMM|nr:archease [Halomonas flagellata]MCH4562250.1 archease [Halomonas flagellata]
MWSHFHHGADIGVRGIGKTLEQAFEEAAVALTAVIAEPSEIRCLETCEVRCEAPDRELLLADWLNALIYEMATRHMLFCRFKVEFQGSQLLGSACGEVVDIARHRPAIEVKGATYTELAVHEDRPGEWRAQCVVDV